jgi:hypothetical protein
MNFQQYINQVDPQRVKRVEVRKEDCLQTYSAKPYGGKLFVVLEVGGSRFEYLLTNENNHLYTMDKDGNKKKISCFLWVD